MVIHGTAGTVTARPSPRYWAVTAWDAGAGPALVAVNDNEEGETESEVEVSTSTGVETSTPQPDSSAAAARVVKTKRTEGPPKWPRIVPEAGCPGTSQKMSLRRRIVAAWAHEP